MEATRRRKRWIPKVQRASRSPDPLKASGKPSRASSVTPKSDSTSLRRSHRPRSRRTSSLAPASSTTYSPHLPRMPLEPNLYRRSVTRSPSLPAQASQLRSSLESRAKAAASGPRTTTPSSWATPTSGKKPKPTTQG